MSPRALKKATAAIASTFTPHPANANTIASLRKTGGASSLAANNLRDVHHRLQQVAFQQVASALGCSGPNLLYPHFTSSPLSSASLLASQIRNRILRNLEHISSSVVIRRTLDIATEKHPAWNHLTEQDGRRAQFEQSLAELERQAKIQRLRLDFNQLDENLQTELANTEDEINKCRLVLKFMQDKIKGNLHPSSLQRTDAVFLTSSEVTQLPSPLAAVRGILVRIKGPRRGTRSMKWQKSAGRVSMNSVGFVTAEEAKIGIPSKLGIYGLTVRIVYGRSNKLVNLNKPLKTIDQPNNQFIFNNSQ